MMRDKGRGTELEARIEEGMRVPGEASAVKACRGLKMRSRHDVALDGEKIHYGESVTART